MSKAIRVAMDQCCSVYLKDYVEVALGHVVVCRAQQGEPDESWLARAFEHQAEVYVTRDKACIMFAQAIGKLIIRPWNNAKRKDINALVEQELTRLSNDRSGAM